MFPCSICSVTSTAGNGLPRCPGARASGLKGAGCRKNVMVRMKKTTMPVNTKRREVGRDDIIIAVIA